MEETSHQRTPCTLVGVEGASPSTQFLVSSLSAGADVHQKMKKVCQTAGFIYFAHFPLYLVLTLSTGAGMVLPLTGVHFHFVDVSEVPTGETLMAKAPKEGKKKFPLGKVLFGIAGLGTLVFLNRNRILDAVDGALTLAFGPPPEDRAV